MIEESGLALEPRVGVGECERPAVETRLAAAPRDCELGGPVAAPRVPASQSFSPAFLAASHTAQPTAHAFGTDDCMYARERSVTRPVSRQPSATSVGARQPPPEPLRRQVLFFHSRREQQEQ